MVPNWCQINGFSPADIQSGAQISVMGPIMAYEFFCASKYHSLSTGSRSRAGPEAHQEVFWRQLLKDEHCMTMPFNVFCAEWSVQSVSVKFTCTNSFACSLFLIRPGVKSLELQPPAQNRRWEAYTIRVFSSSDHAAMCRMDDMFRTYARKELVSHDRQWVSMLQTERGRRWYHLWSWKDL